jgi:hypothetical protein
MSKTKFVLADVVNEARGKHPDIEVELPDGSVASFPPPQRWSDDLVEVAGDAVAVTKLLLGDKYEAFTEAGGSAMILLDIIKESSGVSLGESSPS